MLERQTLREETDSPKTPFWTTISPHDPFSAPLVHPHNLWGADSHRKPLTVTGNNRKTQEAPEKMQMSTPVFAPLACKPERFGEGLKIGKSPKVVRRGCRRSFEPRERKVSCTCATWGRTGAKQGCTWCKRLL